MMLFFTGEILLVNSTEDVTEVSMKRSVMKCGKVAPTLYVTSDEFVHTTKFITLKATLFLHTPVIVNFLY